MVLLLSALKQLLWDDVAVIANARLAGSFSHVGDACQTDWSSMRYFSKQHASCQLLLNGQRWQQ
jgi:hypothetical protein